MSRTTRRIDSCVGVSHVVRFLSPGAFKAFSATVSLFETSRMFFYTRAAFQRFYVSQVRLLTGEIVFERYFISLLNGARVFITRMRTASFFHLNLLRDSYGCVHAHDDDLFRQTRLSSVVSFFAYIVHLLTRNGINSLRFYPSLSFKV